MPVDHTDCADSRRGPLPAAVLRPAVFPGTRSFVPTGCHGDKHPAAGGSASRIGLAALPEPCPVPLRLRRKPHRSQGQGRHGRAESVRPLPAGVGTGSRRSWAGLEGPAFPPRQQGTDGYAHGRGRAGSDPAHLDGGRAQPSQRPAILLGQRADALDRGSRSRLLRGGPRQVRPGQLPRRGRQPEQRPELLLADALPQARPDNADQRVARPGSNAAGLPDRLCGDGGPGQRRLFPRPVPPRPHRPAEPVS